MNTTDGLQLLGGIQDRLDQDHVAGLDQVQAIGTRGQGHEQNFDILSVLKAERSVLY